MQATKARNAILTSLCAMMLLVNGGAIAAEVKSQSYSKKASTQKSKGASYRSISPKSKVKTAKVVYKTPSKKPLKTKNSKSKKNQRIKTPTVFLPQPDDVVSDSVVNLRSIGDPKMERVYLQRSAEEGISIPRAPEFTSSYQGKVVGLGERGELVRYSIDPTLQEYAKAVVAKVPAPHVAVVAIDPRSGRILAIADKSTTPKPLAYHAGFPAASLFKVVTSAAAIEYAGLSPHQDIAFRGGTYELSPFNFDPRPGVDRRIMSVSEALGRSCNPVFSRVALQYLTPGLLRQKAEAFGFNHDLDLQVPLPTSKAFIPSGDFEFGRTAAGFGDVYLSPVHAAVLMSAIANGGKLLEPTVVDQAFNKNGEVIYSFHPKVLGQVMTEKTAGTLMEMMTYTTTVGTSRREFTGKGKVPFIVPAKTGTLRGDNPKGLNNWFIAAAPLEDPKIAVAVIVVNPTQASSKASHIGRLILEKFL